MSGKLLTEHHLEFLGLNGGCTGSSESTFVKMPFCWKSHVAAQMVIPILMQFGFKLEHCKPHKAAPHSTKCDVTNDINCFLRYNTGLSNF